MALSVAVTGDEPPTEFRIFTAGTVATSKGDFTFDEEAAKRVLADYAAQGNELMVDYDHASLCTDAAPDPAQAGKAAGWFGLEMRGGELWAVNVRWTEPAAAALKRKEWRYMSPAFQTEDGRVTALINVALTNIPATKKLEPLMAANRNTGRASTRDLRKLAVGISFAEVTNAIYEALKQRHANIDPDKFVGPWLSDVFDATCVYELEGKLFEVAYTFDGKTAVLAATETEVKRTYAPAVAAAPAPPPAAASKKTRATKRVALGGTMLDGTQVAEALDALIAGDAEKCMAILKGIVTSAAGGETPPAGDEMLGGDEPKPEDEEKQAEVMAATSKLMRLSGKATLGEAVGEVETWRASHLTLETEQKKLAAERATLELSERRACLTHLVTAGARKPFEVWAPDATTGLPDGKTPHEEHASMSLARLKALVAAHPIASKPGAPKPPAGNGTATPTLSDSERRMAADRKWNAEQTAAYVAKRDAIAARSGRKPAQTET